MSNKKQTAVEWLADKLNNDFGNNDFLISYANEISQAKDLEKQQIIDAIAESNKSNNRNVSLNPEQYYNETFNT